MTAFSDFKIHPTALANRAEPVARVASPSETKAAGEGFAAAMATAGEAAASARTTDIKADTAIRPLVKHEARKAPPLEQFEGFVLRSFVESMLPSGDSEFFGKGTAGDIWRSMLAEQIGNEIAKGGGIGIADTIAKKNGVSAAGGGTAAAGEGLAKLRAEDGAALATEHRAARRGG